MGSKILAKYDRQKAEDTGVMTKENRETPKEEKS